MAEITSEPRSPARRLERLVKAKVTRGQKAAVQAVADERQLAESDIVREALRSYPPIQEELVRIQEEEALADA